VCFQGAGRTYELFGPRVAGRPGRSHQELRGRGDYDQPQPRVLRGAVQRRVAPGRRNSGGGGAGKTRSHIYVLMLAKFLTAYTECRFTLKA